MTCTYTYKYYTGGMYMKNSSAETIIITNTFKKSADKKERKKEIFNMIIDLLKEVNK